MIRNSAVMFVLTMLILAVAACQPEPDTPIPPASMSFSVSEPEGFYYEVRGDSAGHQAGQTSQFQLTLNNPTQQDWNLEYCVLILESTGTRTKAANGTTEVTAGASSQETIAAAIPSGLANGAYGFAFIIPNTSAVIDTIWIGPQTGEEPSWDALGLITDPRCG